MDKKSFKVMFNGGSVDDIPESFYDSFSGDYFDQVSYFRYLYEGYDEQDGLSSLTKRLLNEHRIKGSFNYYPWLEAVRSGGYSFSYGSRIHGNVIALQCGIPAFVKVVDSRVREIAELFAVPNSFDKPFDEKRDDLFELYKEISMDEFNERRREKMKQFSKWLNDNEIPNVLEKNDSFKRYISSLDYSGTEKRRY